MRWLCCFLAFAGQEKSTGEMAYYSSEVQFAFSKKAQIQKNAPRANKRPLQKGALFLPTKESGLLNPFLPSPP